MMMSAMEKFLVVNHTGSRHTSVKADAPQKTRFRKAPRLSPENQLQPKVLSGQKLLGDKSNQDTLLHWQNNNFLINKQIDDDGVYIGYVMLL